MHNSSSNTKPTTTRSPGCPNRAYAEAQATQALQADPPTLAAVMFIDLDNVKTVNDAFGHHAGDTVIKTAAQRCEPPCAPRT